MRTSTLIASVSIILLFYIPPFALAIMVSDEGGNNASWSEVDRQWQKWMVDLQKETQVQLGDLQKYPRAAHTSRLYAGFGFCACTDGQVKWSWVTNVADEGACRRMVESKLSAQRGSCFNGKFRVVVIDQWRPSTFPSGRPSDYSGEMTRAIMKQKQTTEENRLGAQLQDAEFQCDRGQTPERRAEGCRRKKAINAQLLRLIERHDAEMRVAQ